MEQGVETVRGSVRCQSCNKVVSYYQRICSFCNTSAGFPNVRAASHPDEQKALGDEFEEKQAAAVEKGAKNQFDGFYRAVTNNSTPVICKSVVDALALINPQSCIPRFHDAVSQGARIATNNEFDPNRRSVDEVIFPNYSSEINFAALSLDSKGSMYYGEVSLELNQTAISGRSTIFKDNSYKLVKDRDIRAANDMPLGVRSTWSERGKLAAVKLHEKIKSDTQEAEYPSILLNEEDDDFLEVHIYGDISTLAISKLTLHVDNDLNYRMLREQLDKFSNADEFLGTQLEKDY